MTSSTLTALLRGRADTQSSRVAYRFLEDGETEEVSMTYGDLDARARAIAAHLQALNAAGSRAMLIYPSGLDYLAAFFGCLYAGVVAVPAYPPRRNRSLDRIDRIVADAEATVILSSSQILDDLERRFTEHPILGAMHRIATDTSDIGCADDWVDPQITPATIAFLQYTSGSTGKPKGVMVTHGNLLHNERLMQRAFQLGSSDVIFGWLPLYHDMGLIGNVMHGLFTGIPCVLMAPVLFLQKPVRWLQGITRYRATVSGGPNFAFDLCARKVTADQTDDLDLSSWSLAFNGSEPIRAETIDRFTERFSPNGFRRESFFPCYGLAEATLFVSGGLKEEAPRIERVQASALAQNTVVVPDDTTDDARVLVSSGRAWPDHHLQIVDPETGVRCDPGRVGEIWVSGRSIAKGYWNRHDETARVFGAKVTGSRNGASLRTGDLGFVRDDYLFVTGRLKDMIVIRGRNHYPQDIEATVAAAHPALRQGFGAAFSIDADGEERLVVVHEVKRTALRTVDGDEVVRAIRKAVSDEHEVHVYTVVLLQTYGLPITTSGKIQRRKCREALLNGTLPEVYRSRPGRVASTDDPEGPPDRSSLLNLVEEDRQPAIVSYLRSVVARALKVSESLVDPKSPLGELGLDSLDLIELKVGIENGLDVVLPSDGGIGDLSIRQLASRLAGMVADDGPSDLEPFGADAPHEQDVFAKCDSDGGYFGAYRLAKDKYFTQPVLDGPIGPRMRFEGREVIVWSINNYLGLARHPHVHDRARDTLEDHGTWAPMGSRLLTGNSRRHMDLEARLARYLQKEASIVFNFGYMGVIGTIASLVGDSDTVIIDSLSHACIVDGALLASRGRQFRVFRHNDMQSLEEQLESVNARRRGGVLVVTEGVYGMTGDVAPLPEICDLKDRYGARLFIDDAHGFGVMGPTGAGTAEHQGVHDRVDLYFGTFAKSFAAIGGVTAGEERVVDYIRYNARPNIFAKSLPMVYVEAVDAALDLIEQGSERRDQVWHIARRLQKGLRSLGFDLGQTSSPITPVYVPTADEATATQAMRLLRSEFGIFVSAVTYPVVPRGVVLFRLTATAAHTDDDVDRTLEAFAGLRKHLDLRAAAGDGHATASPEPRPAPRHDLSH